MATNFLTYWIQIICLILRSFVRICDSGLFSLWVLDIQAVSGMGSLSFHGPQVKTNIDWLAAVGSSFSSQLGMVS